MGTGGRMGAICMAVIPLSAPDCCIYAASRRGTLEAPDVCSARPPGNPPPVALANDGFGSL